MARGRKSGFTAKLLDGVPLMQAADAARFGDVAHTLGGELALDFVAGWDRRRGRPPVEEHEKLEFRDLLGLIIHNKLLSADAQFFRDIANMLEALREESRGTIRHQIVLQMAEFIWVCRDYERGSDPDLEQNMHPLYRDVIMRPRFTPTIAQLHQFVCRAPGNYEDPPDMTTVRDIAIRLGAKAPPRKRRRMGNFDREIA